MKLLIAIWMKDKNKLLLMIAMVLSYTILINCVAGMVTIDSNILLSDNKEQKYYKLYDNYVGEIEKELFQSQESLQKLKDLHLWLSDHESFSYEILNRQSIQISSGSITEAAFESIQVNSSFFEHNNIMLDEGKIFSEKDYGINSLHDTIPLLVGKNFAANTDIGDIITFHYLSTEFTGRVIGILASGSSFMLRNEIYNSDSYIMLPSLQFEESPDSQKEWSFQMKLYLDKTSGIIISELPVRQLSNAIEEACRTLNLEPYGIEENNGYRFNIWGSMGDQLRRIYLIFLIFILIISTICFVIECQNRVLQLRRKYAIFYTNGFHKSKIISSIGIGIFVEVAIPMLVSILLDILIYQNTFIYLHIFGLSFIVSILAFVVCYITMNHIWYWTDTRGKKYGNTTY